MLVVERISVLKFCLHDDHVETAALLVDYFGNIAWCLGFLGLVDGRKVFVGVRGVRVEKFNEVCENVAS